MCLKIVNVSLKSEHCMCSCYLFFGFKIKFHIIMLSMVRFLMISGYLRNLSLPIPYFLCSLIYFCYNIQLPLSCFLYFLLCIIILFLFFFSWFWFFSLLIYSIEKIYQYFLLSLFYSL